MPKKSVIKSNDDTVLWQRVITEVTPLKSTIQSAEFAALFSDTVTPQRGQIKNKAEFGEKMSTDATPLRPAARVKTAVNAEQINPVDLRKGEKAGIDGRTQRRLFRGEVPVDRRLDLHGLTVARAQGQLVQFIETAAYEGCRCILVITGKGSGVLRRHVPEWLKQPPLSPFILALAEARPKDGGGGALYVLLRRKRGN